MENISSRQKARWTINTGWTFDRWLCPVAREPFRDCYCSYLTRRKVPYAVYYCAGNYENCETYRTVTSKKRAFAGIQALIPEQVESPAMEIPEGG